MHHPPFPEALATDELSRNPQEEILGIIVNVSSLEML